MTNERTDECAPLPVFPRCPENRPGLAHIDRRIGAYADIRESLLYHLNREGVLSGWAHRRPDDPGIALLEGAAILGDILTFYQELYANEAYLRTAAWRESVADLVQLLGYRLTPGVGGRAVFAIALRGDAPVAVPAGFPISAQVTGLDGQAEFQTTEELVAYPWLSRFSLYRPVDPRTQIGPDTTELYVAAPDPAISPFRIEEGDRLLIGSPDVAGAPTSLIGAEIVVVDGVRERHAETLYKLKGRLQRTAPVDALVGFKIGRSFRHFGHNAPPTVVSIDADGTASQTPILYTRLLDNTTGATTAGAERRVVAPAIGMLEFPLDARVDDLPPGATLVCQITPPPSGAVSFRYGGPTGIILEISGGMQTAVRTIAGIRQGSYTWGAATGPATVVTLNARLTARDIGITYGGFGGFGGPVGMPIPIPDDTDIRDLQFHETLSPLLHLRARPETAGGLRGRTLGFVGTAAEAAALRGRRLMLLKPGVKPQTVTVQSVQQLAPGLNARRALREVTLDTEVWYAGYPLEEPIVTVHGNLVNATQGKSERGAPLGNGDNRQVFQTFKLPKAPLTYLTVPSETPPETPELQVYVSDRLWRRVPSLFGAGPADEVYIVREDAEGNSYIQFGDGKSGARLPSGVRNVVARYRTGIGAFGALREGTKVQAGGRLDRLDTIALPDIVTGGDQPESADNAREAAPGKVQSLDRLVSLRDYETETLARAGVSRAAAAWRLVGNVPAVVLTVLMDTGRDAEIAQVRSFLTTANRRRGPARFPVIVHAGRRVYFYVAAQVALDPALREELVFAEVRRALGVAGLPGSDADGTADRRFGEREYAARIEGLIQNVAGVRWVRVTALMRLGPAAGPTTLSPPRNLVRRLRLKAGPDEVLALHAQHLILNPVAPPPGEEG
jgi:hypothetical protein